DRIGINGKVMIVGCDFYLARRVIANRMVAAVVTELQFVGSAAESQAGELMPQADAEDRHASHHLANRFHRVVDRFGIAWTIRKEDAVGFERERIFGSGLGRYDGHTAILTAQHAQNVVLDAKIISDHVKFSLFAILF